MRQIKCVGIHIDGVLLQELSTPAIKNILDRFEVPYTRELENNLFANPREKTMEYLVEAVDRKVTAEEFGQLYYQARDIAAQEIGDGHREGVKALFELLKKHDLPMICYGGLDRDHFDNNMSDYFDYFMGPKYICINAQRPGMKKVVQDVGYKPEEMLFIDFHKLAAEESQSLGCHFIGAPSNYDFGYQKKQMIEMGVSHVLSSLKEIDEALLHRIDKKDNIKN